MSSKETNYSDLTYYSYFTIKINRAIIQSMDIPAVGISPVPSNRKLKFKDCHLENDTQCGYDSDNQCIKFLDTVAGEED